MPVSPKPSPKLSPGRRVGDAIKARFTSMTRSKSSINLRDIRIHPSPLRYSRAYASDDYPPRAPAPLTRSLSSPLCLADEVDDDDDALSSDRRPSVARSEDSTTSVETVSSLASAEADLLEVLYSRVATCQDTPDLTFSEDTVSTTSSSVFATPESSPVRLPVKGRTLFSESYLEPASSLLTTPPTTVVIEPLFSARVTPPKRVLKRNGPIPRLGAQLISASSPTSTVVPATVKATTDLERIARRLTYGSTDSLSDFTYDDGSTASSCSSPSASPSPSDLDPFWYSNWLSGPGTPLLLPPLPITEAPTTPVMEWSPTDNEAGRGDQTLRDDAIGLGISASCTSGPIWDSHTPTWKSSNGPRYDEDDASTPRAGW